jgi:F0F1-type ATP synthase assembly protein I
MPQPSRNDAWSGMGIGWAISATLLGGILVWGGIGYLVDGLVGSDRVFTVIGFLLGAVGGITIVYLRYGREERRDG